MRRAKMRKPVQPIAVAGSVTVAVVLGLLATGALAFGHDRRSQQTAQTQIQTHQMSRGGGSITSHRVVRGRLATQGVEWVASTYNKGTAGACVEITGSDGPSNGSVAGCGSAVDPFTYGIGGLAINGTYYRVVYGRASAAAAGLEVDVANGSQVAAHERYLGKGIWFAVYRAVPGDPAADVSGVRLRDSAGHLVEAMTPDSLSAYERASQATRASGP